MGDDADHLPWFLKVDIANLFDGPEIDTEFGNRLLRLRIDAYKVPQLHGAFGDPIDWHRIRIRG